MNEVTVTIWIIQEAQPISEANGDSSAICLKLAKQALKLIIGSNLFSAVATHF